MATNIDLYLPNNGERYKKRRKTQNNKQLYFCPKYIAFHDTKPKNNIYCKVNRMNHYERTAILKEKFERMQREKLQSMQPMNKKQIFQNRRKNRKRKREHLEYDDKNKNRNRINNERLEIGMDRNDNRKRKRRKKSHSKHNKSDHIMSFLMNEILENKEEPYDGKERDTDTMHFESNNKTNRKYNPFSTHKSTSSISPSP